MNKVIYRSCPEYSLAILSHSNFMKPYHQLFRRLARAVSATVISSLFISACSNSGTSEDAIDVTVTDTESSSSDTELFSIDREVETVISVDATLFDTSTDNLSITSSDCTLSDGTETQCYELISTHQATEHDMGPWCPETIFDDASAGGLWFDNEEINALSGEFIANLDEYYDDPDFKMYEDDGLGTVRRMTTAQQCADGADPNIEAEFENMCAQCLPEWVQTQVTYLIPITPVMQETSVLLSDGPTLEEEGIEYGPTVRGLAFNGVRYDHPADIDIILEGHQIAPVDIAGGHVNNSLGYHYHGDTGHTHRYEQDDGHSALIGFALDGHGLYAKLDAEGNEAIGLDECRGHYDDTRGYHYHVLSLESNEFLDCFFGAYAVTNDSLQQDQRPTRPEQADPNRQALTPR